MPASNDSPLTRSHQKAPYGSCSSVRTITGALELSDALMSRGRIFKNTAVLALSLFLFFQGYQALTNLQSTLNSANNLGTTAQAVLFASSMAGTLVLPELLIKTLGCKWTLALSVFFSVPYVASNYWPRWCTMIPTAVLIGMTAGPLITAQATYADEMARRYHRQSAARGRDFAATAAVFYGIYPFSQANTQVWGNVVSYLVLRIGENATAPAPGGCGVDFLQFPNGTSQSFRPPDEDKRFFLVSVYVAGGVLAVLVVAMLLDPLDTDVDRGSGGRCRAMVDRLTAAAKHAAKADQFLLVPISAYCGLESGFYASDFTKAFIACSWGVHHVGFVTICFGVCGALMSVLVGPLVKLISQMSVIILAALINIATIAMLFVWQPSPESPALYFVFAGLFGITDAIWWSQIAALYGLMFPNNREAAFSNFFFWGFFGYFISYSYANYLTVAVKIYIMLAFLVVGIVLFVVGQVKIKCAARADGYTAVVEAD